MELFRKHKLLRIQDIIKLNTLINVCSQIPIIIAYTKRFFTTGTLRLTTSRSPQPALMPHIACPAECHVQRVQTVERTTTTYC